MKPIILAGLILASVSCKKKYTCACTTAWTYETSNGGFDTRYYPADKTAYSEKLTKKQANASCEHQQSTIETSFTSAYTNDGQYQLYPGESIKTNCILSN